MSIIECNVCGSYKDSDEEPGPCFEYYPYYDFVCSECLDEHAEFFLDDEGNPVKIASKLKRK